MEESTIVRPEPPVQEAAPPIKCPYCYGLNPRLAVRVMPIAPQLAGMIFSCGKCHAILAVNAIPLAEREDGLIVKPF